MRLIFMTGLLNFKFLAKSKRSNFCKILQEFDRLLFMANRS
ncbi:hypothetical protein CYK57_01755 [Actinobacillus pleuropneumoniae]|nr:hypothetical protein CYK57_01755 [Actinobacillus pleuropneumoniae]